MTNRFRSIGVLGIAFVAVVALTFGLAALIVPGAAGSGVAPDATPGASGPVAAPTTAIGGTLTVTGDRAGEFRLTRDTYQNGYALVGSDGRITLEGVPAEVVQISYDGLEFFPDPEQCVLTAGNLDSAIGIGFADLRCDDLADIRGNGAISLSGQVGLPVDRLAARQLPATGGTATVGGETWTFEEASMVTWQQPAIAGVSEYSLRLEELGGPPRALSFSYDFETHGLSLANVQVGNSDADIPGGACAFERTELGMHNPRTRVVELSFTCSAVEVPAMGTVAISGTVVVDELQWPE